MKVVQTRDTDEGMKEKYNILLVDDHEDTLEVMKYGLMSEYNVFTANDGMSALSIMEKNKIAIVISDHRMPGMSGVELLKEVRIKYPNTICLIMTGYFHDQDMFMIPNNIAHAQGLIAKPWREKELEFVVKIWIEQYKKAIALEEKNRQLQDLKKQLEKAREELGETRQLQDNLKHQLEQSQQIINHQKPRYRGWIGKRL